ncbi:glycosyltransferase family 2 protein [Acidovorax sp.]|jgi:polyisoprenyl-phosphate glycosyltransferase|uniref:glycosyltransferase family 2 protein n=1 Tax=Acidovorax sp. TaxID=1872122 RepID=UPI00391FA227
MGNDRPLISVLTPCFNEAENIEELCRRIRQTMESVDGVDYEHVLIDNSSTDDTVARIRAEITADPRIRLIVNARNFGQVRSPYYGLLQCKGQAVVVLASDLQDPPELIPEFIAQWRSGKRVVLGVKASSEETRLWWFLRSAYYAFASRISSVPLIQHVTGFGLYDRQVIEIIRETGDPYPYFRGLISDIGLEIGRVEYKQGLRRRGITKNNFYSLYDLAMLGITSHSKVPLRMATMAGFGLSALSLLVALGYLIAKLFFWNSFALGIAPVLISMFFFASVQLFFIGILGEYIGAIHTHVQKRPLVVEKERINFPQPKNDGATP